MWLVQCPAAPLPPLGKYNYYVNTGHFVGLAYDGNTINYKSACAGAKSPELKFTTSGATGTTSSVESCRNNVKCQDIYRMGPLPVGTYQIGDMQSSLWAGFFPYHYDLTMISVSNPSSRSGFKNGGNCAQNDTVKTGTSYTY